MTRIALAYNLTERETWLLEMGHVLWKNQLIDSTTDQTVHLASKLVAFQLLDHQQVVQAYVLFEADDYDNNMMLWQRIAKAMTWEFKKSTEDCMLLLEDTATVVIVMASDKIVNELHIDKLLKSSSNDLNVSHQSVVKTFSLGEIVDNPSLKREVWQSLKHAMSLVHS